MSSTTTRERASSAAPQASQRSLDMAKTFKNYIAGEWVTPSTGAYFENRNPANNSDLIGKFPDSDARDVEAAVSSAKRGFAVWSKTPAPVRGDVLRRVGDLLVDRKDAIATAMTREMGKVVAETKGDVQEGIDTAYYAATEGRRLFGHVVPSELRSKWAMTYRRPIGVVGLITPFNFPLAIPTWKMFPALLCGNSVIIKPSEDVPHTGHVLVEVMLEAGLPPEGIPLVHGVRPDGGAPIVEHPDLSVISISRWTVCCGERSARLASVAPPPAV